MSLKIAGEELNPCMPPVEEELECKHQQNVQMEDGRDESAADPFCLAPLRQRLDDLGESGYYRPILLQRSNGVKDAMLL